MTSNNKKIIAVVGLGYVGLPIAVEFGKHRTVLGFDVNISRIKELNKGIDQTLEISSSELKLSKHLSFTSNSEDIKDARIFIIAVPTPISNSNQPDLKPLIRASEMVGLVLKKNDIVIYESTVYPGCTEEVCVPILENKSGLVFNTDFFCGYSPERINPGDKENTLTKIKKITSGSTIETAEEVDQLYKSIITAGTHKSQSIKVAEAAKIIENIQRDINIALINELSVLFQRLDIDTSEVLSAAGTKWNFLHFRPGLVGGHCIGVDPYYMTYKAEQVGYHPQIISAGRRMNDNMARYSARNVIRLMLKNKINISESKVGVLGFTFKEDCPDIRNTKVVDLVNEFEEWGLKVYVSDPWANKEEVLSNYGIKLINMENFKNFDVIVVAVGHSVYRKLNLVDFKKMFSNKTPILADLKALYDRHKAANLGFTVFRL
jgi:UDP-N-acetyl-D-galactosamine dehydrogenase